MVFGSNKQSIQKLVSPDEFCPMIFRLDIERENKHIKCTKAIANNVCKHTSNHKANVYSSLVCIYSTENFG